MSDHRPWVAVIPAERRREKRRGGRAARHAVAATRPKRRPGVVRHLARPDEVPQRGQASSASRPVAASKSNQNSGAARAPHGSGRGPPLGRLSGCDASESRSILSEVDRHAVEPCSNPDELAGGAELVEPRRLVAGHAPRQDVALPECDRQGKRLERDERLAEVSRRSIPCQLGRKRPKCSLLRRLDLLAKRGQRGRAAAAGRPGRTTRARSCPAGARRGRAAPRAPARVAPARHRRRNARSPRPS